MSTPQNNIPQLKNFNFNVNDDGEMEVIRIDEEGQEIQAQEQVQEESVSTSLPDYGQQISLIQQQQQTIANALGLLLRNQHQQLNPQQPLIQDDVATNLFGDAEKGNAFVDNLVNILTQKLTGVIDQKLSALNPVIEQTQAQTQYQQFMQQYPDANDYTEGMQTLYNANPNAGWNIFSLYTAAKTAGMKNKTSQQNQQNQQNVTPFKRNLPQRIPQQNTPTQDNKQISSLSDAYSAAIEELSAIGG